MNYQTNLFVSDSKALNGVALWANSLTDISEKDFYRSSWGVARVLERSGAVSFPAERTLSKALHFIHDMRFLDGVSLFQQPKLPITSHLVHNKAYFSRHGRIPYIPF